MRWRTRCKLAEERDDQPILLSTSRGGATRTWPKRSMYWETAHDSRYAAMFERCVAANEGAFGAFLMLGDPESRDQRDLARRAGGGRR